MRCYYAKIENENIAQPLGCWIQIQIVKLNSILVKRIMSNFP